MLLRQRYIVMSAIIRLVWGSILSTLVSALHSWKALCARDRLKWQAHQCCTQSQFATIPLNSDNACRTLAVPGEERNNLSKSTWQRRSIKQDQDQDQDQISDHQTGLGEYFEHPCKCPSQLESTMCKRPPQMAGASVLHAEPVCNHSFELGQRMSHIGCARGGKK